MIKRIDDKKIYESLAQVAASGHGKVLLQVLKEELSEVKNQWVNGYGARDEELRGRGKSLQDVIYLLETAEDIAGKMKTRQ